MVALLTLSATAGGQKPHSKGIIVGRNLFVHGCEIDRAAGTPDAEPRDISRDTEQITLQRRALAVAAIESPHECHEDVMHDVLGRSGSTQAAGEPVQARPMTAINDGKRRSISAFGSHHELGVRRLGLDDFHALLTLCG
jgi:hypothetical protein